MQRSADEIAKKMEQVLASQREALARLIEESPQGVDPVALIDVVEKMEPEAVQWAELTRELREQTSDRRRMQEERSTRQLVLRALEEIGTPQNAAFLQEWVWLTERIDLDTRGFGALRRDERNAWRKKSRQRVAYVVPCLDADARHVARWMARSDWPLAERMDVDGAEQLFDLHKLRALSELPLREDTVSDVTPYAELTQYASTILDIEAPSDPDEDWLARIRSETVRRIAELEPVVRKAQQEAAARLAEVDDEEQQLWGRRG